MLQNLANRDMSSMAKTVCIRGHKLEGDNLKTRRNGTKECKQCGRIRRINRKKKLYDSCAVDGKVGKNMAEMEDLRL